MKETRIILFYLTTLVGLIALYVVFLMISVPLILLFCNLSGVATDMFVGFVPITLLLAIAVGVHMIAVAAKTVRQFYRDQDCTVPIIGKIAKKILTPRNGGDNI